MIFISIKYILIYFIYAICSAAVIGGPLRGKAWKYDNYGVRTLTGDILTYMTQELSFNDGNRKENVKEEIGLGERLLYSWCLICNYIENVFKISSFAIAIALL